MKNTKEKYIRRLITVLLWAALCLTTIYILYHNNKAIKLTDINAYRDGVEELVVFYEENWPGALLGSKIDSDRPFPANPMNIPYAVFSSEGEFLVAAYRGIESEQVFTKYEIWKDGEIKGEIRIYYTAIFEQIREHQVLIHKASLLCLGILAILLFLVLYKRNQ